MFTEPSSRRLQQFRTRRTPQGGQKLGSWSAEFVDPVSKANLVEDVADVSPAEICCLTLLIDDDTRHRSSCRLVLSRGDVDEDDLRERAAKYGLEDEIAVLLRYLETYGDVNDDCLPEWDEFLELAANYEVSLASRDQFHCNAFRTLL